ncbi:LysR substrate-binding domain-containing protein [Sorangium sp. So ce887]|uniref:LysR substrate-binding domain-containing protein n=1 Tax=Sorangium sp. So ce887 TaxID=3133324 RepID=UPI003F5FFAC0
MPLTVAGAAVLAPWSVAAHVAQGRLVELFPGYPPPEQGVFAVHPGTEHVPAKVRAFVEPVRAFANHR